MLLTASDDSLAGESPARFRYAWLELFVVSVLWSLAAIGIWGAAWALFGEPVGRTMPAAILAVLIVLWPFRRALAGLLDLSLPDEGAVRAVGAAGAVMLLTMAMLSLRPDWRKDPDLPTWLAWIRPWEKVYRPLVLMPLWGAWSMLVAPQFRGGRSAGLPAVAAFAGGCGVVTAAALMGLLLALTATYYNYLGWWQLPIPASGVIAAIASGVVFCRLDRGLTRRALLAANLATQAAFLLTSLATCNLVYW
jgi:hypothetical protein